MKPKIKPEDIILDVRPIFDQGGRPCEQIDRAMTALKPNQRLILLAPFEPTPLYSKFAARGLGSRAQELVDGSWRVEFALDTPISEVDHEATHLCCESSGS
ncbi:MAG: DUF2249 domain-containing protein [Verrucomicrobia bacterium]|nr:DUF2249 domain-containing protein [Verrucomicrobiota bacterium]